MQYVEIVAQDMSAPIQIRRCEANPVKGERKVFLGFEDWGWKTHLKEGKRYGKMKTHLFQSSRYDILTGLKNCDIHILLGEFLDISIHLSHACQHQRNTWKLRWQSQHVMHWASSSFTLVFSVGLHVYWASWQLAWPAAFVVSAVTPRWTQR